MTPTRAVAERRPATRRGPRRPPERAGPQGAPGVEVRLHQLDRIAIRPPAEERAGLLLDAALAEPARDLPYAPVLEQRFGQPLGWVRVRCGPLVTDALDALDARAATRGDDVFLREPSAPLEVVAHEVTHALQARHGGPGPAGIVARDAAPEVEAAQALRAPVRPAEGLAPGAIALLVRSPLAPAEPTITVEPAPAADVAAPSIAAPAAEAAVPAGPPGPTPGIEAAAGPAAGATSEALALPPPPALAVSAEEVAAREAAIAEAEGSLAAAGSARDLLEAYAGAPPTVKARQAASLAEHLDTVLPAETQQWQSAVPPIDASLAGAEAPAPESLRVEPPPPVEVQLEPEAVAPAPEPEIAEVPEPPPFTANDRVGGAFGRLTEPPPEQLADTIGATLGAVQTSDPSVPRSPGPPPPIPLAGETDPARIAGQEDAANIQAAAARDEAARAVAEGPGPEQVQPTSLHESYALEAVEPPAPTALAVPEGPQAYLALGLPPEVQVTFDEQQQAAMQESMAAATAKAGEATTARDTARDQAVATAQQGAAQLNETAQADQTAAVTDARTTIQTDRQAAIDDQQAEVERIRGEAADHRRTDEGAIDSQVQVEQKVIDDSYVTAESDIAGKVAEGERQAQEKRDQAERDAEDESWWDQAVSFVEEAFDALVSAIGEVFDAVRAAVNEALDALKDFALSVIDRLATFVKDAIAAYGEFLKFAIDTLLGEFFPELAAKLTAAVDTAVAAAQAAVDVVADGLKAGISALVEGLRAGINAALDAYEAAISLAVSVVGAALTGDWGLVARKILEAVLKLVGVDPEAFYAFVGRAQETFDIIVNDPLGFLSNLVSALVGGVQGFADRFAEHLKTGVVGWLTGTLGGAGITVPPTFDLMGVLDLARQILGLTWERIRAKAVTLIGEQNVARLEFIGGYITTLVNEGWSGLWDKITADLSGLLDTVFDGIKSFLLDRVVLAMIKKIPALFGPVGAIVQLVMTAWNLYEFLRDQLSRIGALVQTVVGSIGDIARGMLTGAVAKVEEVLGNLVPVALDLLARLLGLGNVSEDVRKIIEKVQAFIDKAIDGLITRVIGLFTGKPTGAPPPGAADAQEDGHGETIDEPLRLAGENHTLRAVIVGGRASVLMASDIFLPVLAELDQLLKNLRHLYTEKGGAFYGTPRAQQFEQDFEAIAATAVILVAEVDKEQDPARERVAVTKAITRLKEMLNALGLPEAVQPEDVHLPPHKARGQSEPRWGRPQWSEVDPLTVNSLGQGGPSGIGIPGIRILAGYDEGHLVAQSLGGAGSSVNMAPMSIGTNRTWSGVRSIEDSVFKALIRTQNVPEAAPGYIIRYHTACAYDAGRGLESELTSRVSASPGVEVRLFDLAEPGTEIGDSNILAALGRPGPPAPDGDAALVANVRRRLAFYFMPTHFAIEVQVEQQPEREDFQQPIAASQTVKNHIGSSVEWR